MYIFFSIKTINHTTTPGVLIRLMETALSALSSLLFSHYSRILFSTLIYFYINSTVLFLRVSFIFLEKCTYIFPQNCYSVINDASFLCRVPLHAWKSSVSFSRIPSSTTYLFSRLRPPLLRGWRQSDSRGPVILAAEGGVPPTWHDEQSRRRPSSLDG